MDRRVYKVLSPDLFLLSPTNILLLASFWGHINGRLLVASFCFSFRSLLGKKATLYIDRNMIVVRQELQTTANKQQSNSKDFFFLMFLKNKKGGGARDNKDSSDFLSRTPGVSWLFQYG